MQTFPVGNSSFSRLCASYPVILTAAARVVGLVGARRAGRQAVVAGRAQQMGETGLAAQSAGTGGTG